MGLSFTASSGSSPRWRRPRTATSTATPSDTATARTWYGIDGQGSVRQSLDNTGVILGVQSYDSFGQVEAGSSLIGPFGYTGDLQEGATGQEYLRARWYQPGSGTLLGVDPLLDLARQPYRYACDDPVNESDHIQGFRM